MKKCKRCGGSGVNAMEKERYDSRRLGGYYVDYDFSLCPCMTDRLSRYERALKQISGEIPMPMGEDEEILEHHWRIAKAALEDT